MSVAPLASLSGAGPKTIENLARLGIHSQQDLLFHLPLRYEDRTRITSLGDVRPGDHVLVEGTVETVHVIAMRKKQLVCRIHDGRGSVNLRFFHFTASQKQRLQEGVKLRCFGEVRQGYTGGLEMMHPEFRQQSEFALLPLSDYLTPVYPTTKGLHQNNLRKLVNQVLGHIDDVAELLPAAICEQHQLVSLQQALLYVHRPPPGAPVDQLLSGQHPMQQRLAFEELVAHQLSLQKVRFDAQSEAAPVLDNPGTLRAQLAAALPYELTAAQQRVLADILNDVRQPYPMLRLVQGDVGCGKTIVAAMAMLQAVEQGYQAVLMAPTELLMAQHLKNFKQWLSPLGVTVGCLSGSQTTKERQQQLASIANGDAQVVVGTHALFQKDVQFKNLAMLVVDEQHRFGVQQRLMLKEKGMWQGLNPHQLVMTATPIPRTLAMTAYADLACSVIDELPPGRQPITTILVPNSRREEIISRVQAVCDQGQQVYWICTLVEESDVLQCEAAENTAEKLQQLLPQVNVGLVHGRLKGNDKEAMMQQFKNNEIQLLVATTVVEVGVDVPNAVLIMIENPERLGLAQLHQLRGRIGRGQAASYCVLLYKVPLSETARQRLQVMRATQDGFVIAQRDLEMRGPGEVLGTRQAGLMRLRIADLLRDHALIEPAQQVGKTLVEKYPDSIASLMQRWIADADRYATV